MFLYDEDDHAVLYDGVCFCGGLFVPQLKSLNMGGVCTCKLHEAWCLLRSFYCMFFSFAYPSFLLMFLSGFGRAEAAWMNEFRMGCIGFYPAGLPLDIRALYPQIEIFSGRLSTDRISSLLDSPWIESSRVDSPCTD